MNSGRRIFSNLDMWKKFAVLIVPVILISFVTNTIVINKIFKNYLINTSMEDAASEVKKLNSSCDSGIANIKQITASFMFDEHTQNSLVDEEVDYYIRSRIQSNINNMRRGYIMSITFIDNKENIYSSDIINGVKGASDFINDVQDVLKGTNGELTWVIEGERILAARKVFFMNASFAPGVLILEISPRMLVDMFNKIRRQEGVNCLITDREGHIIYNDGVVPDNSNIISVIKGNISMQSEQYTGIVQETGVNIILSCLKNDETGWYVSSTIPFSVALYRLNKVMKIIFLLTVVLSVITLIFTILVSYSITNPIKRLAKKMRRVKDGKFDIGIETTRNDEIGELEIEFCRMLSDIESLIKKVTEEQEKVRTVEINSLIYQINPHFLYNTLDNINALAEMAGEKRISGLILRLSGYLRLSLNKGRNFLTVKDELKHMEHYLEIHKYRFGDFFDYKIEADEEILHEKVLKLILQPCAENAISHGFRGIDYRGMIQIKAYKEYGSIIFEVSDNGKGMPEEIMETLNAGTYESDNDTGYGILNVNSRLALFYNEGCRVFYKKNSFGGITASVKLPLKTLS